MFLSRRASSELYFMMTSAFASWQSRRPTKIISEFRKGYLFPSSLTLSVDPLSFSQLASNVSESFCAIKAHGFKAAITQHFQDLKHLISCFFQQQILTWAYSWPSSFKISSRLAPSFSFFPRRRFLPPFPLFLGMAAQSISKEHELKEERMFIMNLKGRRTDTRFRNLENKKVLQDEYLDGNGKDADFFLFSNWQQLFF